MMSPSLACHSQPLSDALAPVYGDRLESLFKVEKLQLIGAITLWAADCEVIPEAQWQPLGEHAAATGTVFQDFDAFDIVQNECNFTNPSLAMPLVKALIAQIDHGIYLRSHG